MKQRKQAKAEEAVTPEGDPNESRLEKLEQRMHYLEQEVRAGGVKPLQEKVAGLAAMVTGHDALLKAHADTKRVQDQLLQRLEQSLAENVNDLKVMIKQLGEDLETKLNEQSAKQTSAIDVIKDIQIKNKTELEIKLAEIEAKLALQPAESKGPSIQAGALEEQMKALRKEFDELEMKHLK